LNSKKNNLRENGENPIFSSQLPSGYLDINENYTQKVVIMVSVIDSLGGVNNQSIEVEVFPEKEDFNTRLIQIETFFN
jgi:hypothetical protein